MRLFEGTPFDRPPRASGAASWRPSAAARRSRAWPPSDGPRALGLEKRKRGSLVRPCGGCRWRATICGHCSRSSSPPAAPVGLGDEVLEVQGDQRDRLRGGRVRSVTK